MKKVSLIIKGNLIAKSLINREREREREYKNNLDDQTKSELFCGCSKDFLDSFDTNDAIIIEGDLKIQTFCYSGIVLVTGGICCNVEEVL
jgi:hypothetical protein|nr:MAG TPA: hypothetical protein [Caudoviricetes sp.]